MGYCARREGEVVGGGLEAEDSEGAQLFPPFNPAGFIESWLSGCGGRVSWLPPEASPPLSSTPKVFHGSYQVLWI